MRKAMVAMLLVVMSSSAAAEWVKIDSDGRLTVYADPTSRRRSGNLVKVSVLNDHKAAQITPGTNKNYLSVKVRTEYDCEKVSAQGLSMIYYSENMGRGQKVESVAFPEPNWKPIVTGTIDEFLWKLNCLKR